jgi:mannose-6-phosphate isomerase-like protein (cupin superfamily)/DNA-binding XRE family transcriptional regulator
MPEKIKNIASRIKELREIAGISPETLAHEFNIPGETYLEYESGVADIPVGFLYKIAQRFRVELTDLITGESPKLHMYALTRKGQGISVERRKQYNYESLAYNFIHKKAEPFLVTVKPGAPGEFVSFNSHPGQEFTFVLEGTMKIIIHDHELVLNEGDSLFFDSSVSHGMQAMNNKPARFLAIIL